MAEAQCSACHYPLGEGETSCSKCGVKVGAKGEAKKGTTVREMITLALMFFIIAGTVFSFLHGRDYERKIAQRAEQEAKTPKAPVREKSAIEKAKTTLERQAIMEAYRIIVTSGFHCEEINDAVVGAGLFNCDGYTRQYTIYDNDDGTWTVDNGKGTKKRVPK
ncbi:hypothetical protein HPT27_09120 [Permianibacter sp. IMCC34836]|uniref:hypothetical protein n=1 Tax=Permianibacter fluminis TaxID=2738515 RepID=UPI0015538F2E|nr:hypothetical protein [Permianibacter fluminis]NQD37186.1 hypothetical protein [Permianibacter fluminis]